jgi:hypothetical protein
MMKESINHPNTVDCKIYTRGEYYHEHRKIYKRKNVERLPNLTFEQNSKADQPRHWGSGPYAVFLATRLGFTNVDIIGFDLYGLQGKTNNVYKNTNNYADSDRREVDPSFWIYQLGKVIYFNPQVTFNFYNKQEWIIPEDWKIENCVFKKIDDLSLTLNTEPV